jgi:hypothetical protein
MMPTAPRRLDMLVNVVQIQVDIVGLRRDLRPARPRFRARWARDVSGSEW